ncbi:TPA: glycosyltransferase family 4 protein [Streptococcus suis]|nr:glycosyltransferase family 4 protein [Streptococcus suis]
MKRILFISPTTSMDNGAEKSIYYLMKYLIQLGHTVINVTHAIGGEPQDKHEQLYKMIGVKNYYLPTVKWWWPDAPGGEILNREEATSYYRQNVQDIAEIIEQNEIDLVISNTVNVFQGAIAASCQKVPHFWLIHEFPKNEFAYYADKIDFIEEYSSELFSVTGELNNFLTLLFNKKVHSFISYTEQETKVLKKGNQVRIVSVGRLTEGKNQLELIKAYKTLNRLDIELVFIGGWDSKYKAICDEYIHENKLQKNVKFLGNLDNPWEEVTDRDICVFPSSMETFGLVYVEAILRGLPVILSDNLGHLTAFEIFSAGQIYKLGDIEELVTKLEQVIESFRNFSDRAQLDVERLRTLYTPEVAYKEILNGINHLEYTGHQNTNLSHIKELLTLNMHPTRLERYARLISNIATKIRHKLRL